ncbi:MAG: hypothetical protein AAGJ37_07330 [Pseudomonadota bacterium]
MIIKSNLFKALAGTVLLSAAVVANASIPTAASQALIDQGSILTSENYASEFNVSAPTEGSRLVSNVVTKRNILTSNYLASVVSDESTRVVPIPEFEDEIDATITDENILSSKYRAIVSSQGE